MADISKFSTGNNEYNFKDAQARNSISNIESEISDIQSEIENLDAASLVLSVNLQTGHLLYEVQRG